MLEHALAWHDAGYSVVPVATDGSKAVLVKWKQYQHTPADTAQLEKWFGNEHPGIGVVCGAVSGNLEMFEFEGRAVSAGINLRFRDALIHEHDAAELWQRIADGYMELSPSDGLHLFYRVDGDGSVSGNTKLAECPNETPPPNRHALIETRGEGGYVAVAPSHGPVHPTGKPWRALRGTPADIPTITPAERDLLHAVARSLDEMPPPAPMPDPIPLDPTRKPGDVHPGEDYTRRATWPEVLTPHGWTVARVAGDRTYWTRPGKAHGVSAVTGGPTGDYLWCWSTSTDLPSEQAMSQFRAYTMLNHGGDFSAAASALRRNGYGSARRDPTTALTLPTVDVHRAPGIGTPAHTSNGLTRPLTAATVPAMAETATWSDDGNAVALVHTFGHLVRYVPEWRRWCRWNGARWESTTEPNGGSTRELVKEIGRAMPDTGDTEAKRHKRYSLSAVGTTNALTQASSDPAVRIGVAELDAIPYELNTPSGIVDLRTGEVMPHDPTHLHTKSTTVAPDWSADITPWHTFLAQTFDNRPDLIAYVQRLLGYSLSGYQHEQVLPFAYGTGANGKGVLLETVRRLLGDYATAAPAGFLVAQRFQAHPAEIARLVGMRLVLCSEVNEGDAWDESKVKALTGGDTLTARFMARDFFSFQPTHTLWLMANDQPNVATGGHSLWRRIRVIPFTYTVPAEQRISGLEDTLVREHGAGILAWLIDGAVDYFANGLQQPPSIERATGEYETDQDSVTGWFNERCKATQANVQIRVSIAKSDYAQWCKDYGMQPVSDKRLTMTLKNRYGITSERSRDARYFGGLILYGRED
jgi:P4 family phage/plasmid primase-like protien